MRHAGFLLLIVVLLGAGCQNLSPEPPPVHRPATTAKPLLQPLDGVVGRVQTVNTRLNFVVLDFSLNQMPAIGDRLDLLRDGTVVAELKVTGPIRNASIVADIVSGTPRVEDLARPKPSPASP